MSTWFSHLSSDPTKFGLDLTPFLEKEYMDDPNSPEGYLYYLTDNHSQEYLIPTMVVVLSYMANNKFTVDTNWRDYNYEHFWNSCLSYVDTFYKHNELRDLTFFRHKYKIVDSLYLFNKNDIITDFKIFVAWKEEKQALVELFIALYEYGIAIYKLDNIKEVTLSSSETIEAFLNKFIAIKKN